MRTEMLSTAEEQRRGRKSEGLEITNFISFLLCCLGSIAENQCELCFPMLRVQVGKLCVCKQSMPAGLCSWQGAQTGCGGQAA